MLYNTDIFLRLNVLAIIFALQINMFQYANSHSMKKNICLKDIAKKAGVSITTVSLVLNGKEKNGRIGAVVADKIKCIAKEMNYSPNNIARGLRVGRTNTISLIVADISNSFFASLAFYIQEQAEIYGYTVIITNTNESTSQISRIICAMKSSQVDGFIIVPTEESETNIEYLQKSGTPFVLLDRYFPNIPSSHVIVNNYHAAYEGTRFLISSGCKRIAMLIYATNLQHIQDRRRGYEDALKKESIFFPSLVKCVSYERITEDIRQAINELMNESIKVDGIFFATNSMSLMGIKQLLRLHIQIPEKFKIVCFDKSDAFDFSTIPISYIQQPISEIGKMSVHLLLDQIKGERLTPVHIELYASLIMKFKQPLS